MSGGELLQQQPAKQRRENRHREEIARATADPALAVEREAAAWHDHVDVRMVSERRAPGMEDREDADAGAEALGLLTISAETLLTIAADPSCCRCRTSTWCSACRLG